MKFLKNVDHANILNGFVKELADAVTDYQVCDPDSIVGSRLTLSTDIFTTEHSREHQEDRGDHKQDQQHLRED